MPHRFSRLTMEMVFGICADEEEAWNYFLYARYKGRKPSCPHCNYTDVLARPNSRIYRCRNKRCRRKFSPTTNTIFEKSKIPMHFWMTALLFMIQGDGSSALSFFKDHRDEISYDTAWFMVHRIRQLFAIDHDNVHKRTGIHEIDDKQFGLELSQASKSVRKKHKNIAGYTHTISILLCHTRGKGTYAKVMCKNTKKVQEQEVIKKVITKSSTVYSDKSILYRGLEDYFASMTKFNHSTKTHGDGRGGHTNNVNQVARRIDHIKERYRRPSSTYMQRYIDESMFYANNNLKGRTTADKFKFAMKNVNRRITRKQLKAEGKKNDDWIYINIPHARPLPPKPGKRVRISTSAPTLVPTPNQSNNKAA